MPSFYGRQTYRRFWTHRSHLRLANSAPRLPEDIGPAQSNLRFNVSSGFDFSYHQGFSIGATGSYRVDSGGLCKPSIVPWESITRTGRRPPVIDPFRFIYPTVGPFAAPTSTNSPAQYRFISSAGEYSIMSVMSGQQFTINAYQVDGSVLSISKPPLFKVGSAVPDDVSYYADGFGDGYLSLCRNVIFIYYRGGDIRFIVDASEVYQSIWSAYIAPVTTVEDVIWYDCSGAEDPDLGDFTVPDDNSWNNMGEADADYFEDEIIITEAEMATAGFSRWQWIACVAVDDGGGYSDPDQSDIVPIYSVDAKNPLDFPPIYDCPCDDGTMIPGGFYS